MQSSAARPGAFATSMSDDPTSRKRSPPKPGGAALAAEGAARSRQLTSVCGLEDLEVWKHIIAFLTARERTRSASSVCTALCVATNILVIRVRFDERRLFVRDEFVGVRRFAAVHARFPALVSVDLDLSNSCAEEGDDEVAEAAAAYGADGAAAVDDDETRGGCLQRIAATALDGEMAALLSIGCSTITKLSVHGNELTHLPDSLCTLRSIVTLDASPNQLVELPAHIGNLTSLKELFLSENELTALPDSIAALRGLELLSLADNRLSTLPDAIGSLRGLKDLNLGGNQLTTLPDSIGGLRDLEKLGVLYNKLVTLPSSIGSLVSLQHLWLYGNMLTDVPASIGHLSSLVELNLGDNKLTVLPESIGALTKLEFLWIFKNRITVLPNAICSLTGLKKLSLKGNPLVRQSSAVDAYLSSLGLSVGGAERAAATVVAGATVVANVEAGAVGAVCVAAALVSQQLNE